MHQHLTASLMGLAVRGVRTVQTVLAACSPASVLESGAGGREEELRASKAGTQGGLELKGVREWTVGNDTILGWVSTR